MSDGVASTAVKGYETVSTITDTAGSLMSKGLDLALDTILWPFVAPLLQVFEQCVGDPEQLDGKSQAWEQAAQQLIAVADAMDRQRALLGGAWAGEASSAAQASMAEYARQLRETARSMTDTAGRLHETAHFLTSVEEELRTIVREIAEWLIAEWILAQLLAPETWGASEATFLGIEAPATGAVGFARCAEVMSRDASFLAKIAKIYQLLRKGSLLEKMGARVFKSAVLGKGLHAITGLDRGFGAVNEILGDPLDKIDDFTDGLLESGAKKLDPLLSPIEPVVAPVEPVVDDMHERVEQWSERIDDAGRGDE